MEDVNPNYLTYLIQRQCNHCKKPIADQVHGATLFCAKEVLPDGSIKSCKDDFHAEKNRLKNLPYQNIANFHKKMNEQITSLSTKKGEIVTAEQLDQFEIRLDRSAMIEMPATQKGIYYFVGFSITQINKSQFKISTHDVKSG